MTGWDCPGCGLQRSLLSFVKGEFMDAFIYWPGLFPLLLAIGLTIFYQFRHPDWAINLATKLYWVTGGVILTNFLLKFLGLIPCPV